MATIKDSLILYYTSCNDFSIIYPKFTSVKFIDHSSDTVKNEIIINNDKYTYSVLGRFDSSTNFWEWGWSYETIKNKTYDTRGFLNFGLDVPDTIIKNILINSKIKITEKINLDIILALSLMLLYSVNYKYIHTIKESDTINKYIALKKLN